jgi:hypothetical protein
LFGKAAILAVGEVIERFRLDCTVDPGRFACGPALCGAAEVSLPWLAMSRHHALFHKQLASASPGTVKTKTLYSLLVASGMHARGLKSLSGHVK